MKTVFKFLLMFSLILVGKLVKQNSQNLALAPRPEPKPAQRLDAFFTHQGLLVRPVANHQLPAPDKPNATPVSLN